MFMKFEIRGLDANNINLWRNHLMVWLVLIEILRCLGPASLI